MTEEGEEKREEQVLGAEQPSPIVDAESMASKALDGLTQTARVSAVFGEPRTIGDRTIIPVARVFSALGFGSGGAEGPTPEGRRRPRAGGGGGGGSAVTTPTAVIEVSPEGVRVQPIVDVTQVALAAIAAWAFNIYWFTRLMRSARAAEQTEAGKGATSPGRLRKLLGF